VNTIRTLLRLGALLLAVAGSGAVQAQEDRQASITADVDVYDAPFAQGNILGFVRAGVEVRTWPEDCVDGWCPIAGDDVPRGFAWVWSDFLAPAPAN
jgi:hypothetical protein